MTMIIKDVSSVVTSEDTHTLVSILTEDSVLVENRERIFGALGIPAGMLQEFRTEVLVQGSGVYGFLTKTINHWISLDAEKATFENLVQILEKESFITVAGKICTTLKLGGFDDVQQRRSFSPRDGPLKLSRGRSSSPIWFDVPPKLRFFTGREEKLSEIHRSVTTIQDCDGGGLTTLTGMGGIGKTTLAAKYVWEYHTYFSSNVIWINAENLTSLNDSFIRLATELQLQITEPNGVKFGLERISTQIYQLLRKSKALFVFDNAESYEDIKTCLPPTLDANSSSPHILVSSRNKIWNDKFHIIELDVFTDEEAIQFLQNYLKLESEQDLKAANQLCRLLQNLPIAIRQAGAYIKMQKENSITSNSYQVSEYLEEFEVNCKELLDFEFWRKTGENVGKTTLLTWDLTYKKMKTQNKLALQIMEFIAYLSPEVIPIEFFYHLDLGTNIANLKISKIRKYFRIESEETVVKASINFLVQYSIIAVNNGLISVHRLVQRILREQNKNREKKLLLKALKVLSAHNFKDCEYRQHLQSVWKYALEYDELIHRFPKFGIDACKLAPLNEHDAEQTKIIEATILKFKKIHPKKLKYTMEIMCDEIMSSCRSNHPNCNVILKLSEILLENCEGFKFELKGRFTIYNIANVGDSLFSIACRRDEEKLYEPALKFYKIFHEINKDRGSAGFYLISHGAVNIIKCLVRLDRINEALETVKEVEDIFCRNFEQNYFKTFNALNTLASCLLEHGRIKNTLLHHSLVLHSHMISSAIYKTIETNGGQELDIAYHLQQITTKLLLLVGTQTERGFQLEHIFEKIQIIFNIVERNSDQINFLDVLFNTCQELSYFGYLTESLKYLKFVEEKQMGLDCLDEYKEYHLIKTRKLMGGIYNQLGDFRQALEKFLVVHHSMKKLRFFGPENSETELVEKEIRAIRKL